MSITMRPIEASDLDALVQIAITAFPYDEQWVYRYPYREEFPEDHQKYTHLYYSEYLKATFNGQNTIMVAVAPDLEDPAKRKVVALSIWDNPGNKSTNPDIPAVAPPNSHPKRRDCNPARLKAFAASTMKARKELFVNRYGQRQLALRQLVTLPDYRKRSAASMLLRWGRERAKKEGVVVTKFAGNMGKVLYAKSGFDELGFVRVHVEGEKEVMTLTAMSWDPRSEEDSRAIMQRSVD